MTTTGKPGLIIVQAGRSTAVTNASVCGVIEEARRQAERIGFVYGAQGGLPGLLEESLVDLLQEEPATLEALATTPGAALGTSRRRLQEDAELHRILDVLRAHEARWLLILGNGDAMASALRLHEKAVALGQELGVLGLPHTINNDLADTDHTLGFGSAARLAAVAAFEVGLESESAPGDEGATILETMGRDAGWLAAAAGLARRAPDAAPHLIYVPEAPVSLARVLEDARAVRQELGRLFVVVAEGCVDEEGRYLGEQGGRFARDAAGQARLGGLAETLRQVFERELGLKCRTLRLGVWQRCGASLASATDLEEARRCGREAVALALAGQAGVMLTLARQPGTVYNCRVTTAPLAEAGQRTHRLPRSFMNERGNFITARMQDYAAPLIRGRVEPVLAPDGLPLRPRLKRVRVAPRTGPWRPSGAWAAVKP